MVQSYTFSRTGFVETAETPFVFHFFEISQEEMDKLVSTYKLDPHNIASALDPEEVARFEYDDENRVTTLIWKIPTTIKLPELSSFNVVSMGFFVVGNSLLVISPEECRYFSPMAGKNTAPSQINDPFDILLVIIERTIRHFVEHLRVIKMISKEIQQKLNSSMGNEYLLQMFSLSEILIYYLDAINSNRVVLQKFAQFIQHHHMGDIDFLMDLQIEIEQAARQAEIYSEVFTGLMDARGSIVNNNMNMLMKKLTILNSIFLPLNLIAGIGGMSEYTMITAGLPWPVSYGVMVALMAILGIVSYRLLDKMQNVSQEKKKTSKK
ncbi:MAG: magnesium transporter CorA family protein [Treponemataceae bacterium]|nr:magnesium transporter CorA family protein [Treponemataceae bacterium]